MKLVRALPILCFISFVSPEAKGDVVLDAPGLLDACTRADMHWVDFCNGYFQAVSDVTATAGLACIPAGTSRTRLVELFERHAASLPDFAETSGFTLAARIIAEAYPCQ